MRHRVGRTAEGGPGAIDLLGTKIPIVSTEVCNRPESYGGDVTAAMMRAGKEAGGVDSCRVTAAVRCRLWWENALRCRCGQLGRGMCPPGQVWHLLGGVSVLPWIASTTTAGR